MRQALRMWIEKQRDLEVIAEASDGLETLDIATKLCPDVVIMDISMPKLSGLEATKQIVARCPNTSVLGLTFYTDNEHIMGIKHAGASGYLSKNASGDEIIHAVRSVVAGESVFPPAAPQSEAENATGAVETSPVNILDRLTSREMAILKLVANGLSNKEIAVRLDLSLPWVKANLSNIFLKLGANSRTEAISIGLKTGIITINDLNQ
jgi:DNA-binding NarL/FixJ family response regulator